MMNFELYSEALNSLYVCAVSRLMMEAKDLKAIEECYFALYDHGNTLKNIDEWEAAFTGEMPEVSPEEALEAVVAEMLKEAFIKGSTAHKVGA